MKRKILIADDEKNTREGLRLLLQDRALDIRLAADGQEALQVILAETVDVVLADLKMPHIDGIQLLKKTKEESPDTEVIILTGHGTIESARSALKMGAYDYLTKPVDIDELSVLVDRVIVEKNLRDENRSLHEALDHNFGFESIVGQSESMQRIFRQIRQVAPTKATVLIRGESGTGKELIARAIHQHSDRVRKAFVPVNCGALAASLLETELFGHERGAFTDAVRQKAGRFELADHGTLFLDEVSETSLDFQVKLLRVLETGQFERVGGTETLHANVRIVAATNKDLETAVKNGNFREDLFYRLNVIQIELPPLRNRLEDVPLLANAFLKEFCKDHKRKVSRISPAAMSVLQRYSWPGNIRQLRNVLEGAVIMMTENDAELTPQLLPDEIRGDGDDGRAAASSPEVRIRVGTSLRDAERELIRATLTQTSNNRARTARLLGMGRKTLYRKLEEYGL